MATFNANSTTNGADVLNSSVAAAAAAATFLVPSNATPTVAGGTPLHLEQFGALPAHQQYMNAAAAAAAAAAANPLQHHHQQTNSSYTFVQIKREPCQVSEISSNNCHQQQQQQHHQQQQQQLHHHHTASTSLGSVSSSVTASATSKTMSSSTLTTLVKIEASSPKVADLEKSSAGVSSLATSNSVPVGIAVARKRPQETSAATLNSATALPLQQQPLNKDMNCFGIRVADLGATSCGNLYFTGNGDLMTSTATAEELALSAVGVNRAPSTFWQYPNPLPIESVISMSPATVGLQYSREASRGQVVLLPAAPAALGISNFPILTPTDPFQQAAAAAAFVWPSAYIPQATASSGQAAAAAAAAAALQPSPNFIFPSLGPHSTLNTTPSYASTLQLYLAAAATGSSTLCQHTNQQTNTSSTTTTNSINLSLAGATSSASGSSSSCMSASSSTSSRFLSLAPAPAPLPLPLPLPPKQLPMGSLLLPPSALKMEDFNGSEYKHTTLATQPMPMPPLVPLAPPPQTMPLNYETRDKLTTTTSSAGMPSLLELQASSAQHALNLMRLPTPPTSATMESALGQQSHQILFQAATPTTPTPALLNLSMHGAASLPTPTMSIGPPTPAPCDEAALNYKVHTPLTPQTPPRMIVSNASATSLLLPQMQDVNIQTDTPVCSEDENSSCPLKTQEADIGTIDAAQPLELTKSSENVNECHTQASPSIPYSPNQSNEAMPMMQSPRETTHETLPSLIHPVPQLQQQQQTSPEDLTGLELLSNISTNSTPLVRVKQEPVDHSDRMQLTPPPPPTSLVAITKRAGTPPSASAQQVLLDVTPPEPLGGLKLLCALAEQRIQEEVVQGSSLFATPTSRTPSPPSPAPSPPALAATSSMMDSNFVGKSCFSFGAPTQQPSGFRLEASSFQMSLSSSFPSMEGIELPSTSGRPGGGGGGELTPIKRKKHKHSKSSSSASDSRRSSRCSKKSKKKRKHNKHLAALAGEDFDLQDEQLQSELRSALNTVDPSYAQRFGQQVFNIMDNNMRMRLADITRQYRKKKRKLDEISKHKKKKKCSKQQQIQPQPAQLTLTSTLSALHTGSGVLGTSSPLRDYKFPKFSSSNLQATSFRRFPEKTHSFPPPASQLDSEPSDCLLPSTSPSTSSFVRLEPSALDAANNSRSLAAAVAVSSSSAALSANSCLAPNNGARLAHKHPASDKAAQQLARKERKLMAKTSVGQASTATGSKRHSSSAAAAADTSASGFASSAIDRELQLTGEHLYREETRVLTDMGGLFYAGVMKPLRPPDVYAITLDGERGNKSHVMSREDILKDTILEVAPKSVDSVPVGTRLCAYWSQQYRCLYPGRAIESEATEEGVPAAAAAAGTPQDFVSVEFDDGDSGRIRLQNIRLLLSNYPIAEYNDNPLYSLGKQKRGSFRSGEGPALQEHSSLSGDDHHIHHGFAMSNDNMTSIAATMELFTQRSEKKRLKKSLKKITKSQTGGAQSATSNGCHNGGADAGANNDTADGSRKHHKHKKRKKHKKHHRKNANEAESQSYLTTPADENEMPAMAEAIPEPAALATPDLKAVQQQRLKIEAQACAALKVKTEQLDMEEETTSNMMSEISDEAKGDELVEHNNSKGSSKIAAFLPERQLWGWFGTAYRKAGVKGRARKQFYKTIKRGKETITVGDCAVFLSTGRPDRPYIGRIESMWETTTGNKVVRVAWFYHPEETTGCPSLKYPGALFESPHEDENDVQTISHRCEVLQFPSYFGKFGADSKQYQSIYDNNDTYYLAGHYNPRLQVLKLQDDIPTLEELQHTTTTTTKTTTTTTYNNNATTTEN